MVKIKNKTLIVFESRLFYYIKQQSESLELHHRAYRQTTMS